MKANHLWVLSGVLLLLGVWGFQHYGANNEAVSPFSRADESPKAPQAESRNATAYEKLAVLDYDLLPEASGLAVSGIDPQRFWLINDSGSRSELVTLDLDGGSFRRVNILDTPNRDWEDMEAFEYRGKPWIAIGDVGDNKARRKHVSLYFLPEPTEDEKRVKIRASIELSYPDGPRDVESIAVDPHTEVLYLLSKRDKFPRLYGLPLPDLESGDRYELQPKFLGELRSIPAPTADEIRQFPKYGKFRSQPTAMTYVPTGNRVALLTYGNTYVADLGEERDWVKALNEGLCFVPRPELKQAESIAADSQGRVYVTSEGKEAPLLRLTPPTACQQAL